MQNPRLITLQQRHAQLEAQLHTEATRPYPNPLVIQRLKKEKLNIRDQMTALTALPLLAA
jgi:hypothetical protein